MLTLYRITLLISSSLFFHLCSAQEPENAQIIEPVTAKQEYPRSTILTRNILAAQAIQLGLDAHTTISLTFSAQLNWRKLCGRYSHDRDVV